MQRVIDDLVDQLYERTVKIENTNSVEIDFAHLAGRQPYLLRELLVLVWRRQSWPMRAMGFSQWDQLARMLADTNRSSPSVTSKQIFPGNVQAEIRDGKLRLYARGIDRHGKI